MKKTLIACAIVAGIGVAAAGEASAQRGGGGR